MSALILWHPVPFAVDELLPEPSFLHLLVMALAPILFPSTGEERPHEADDEGDNSSKSEAIHVKQPIHAIYII